MKSNFEKQIESLNKKLLVVRGNLKRFEAAERSSTNPQDMDLWKGLVADTKAFLAEIERRRLELLKAN